MGDDYTLGVGASSPSKTWTAQIAKSLNLSRVIVGQTGAGYAKPSPDGKTYGSLVNQVVQAKPQVVVVSGGRNDVSDDVGTLSAAASDLFTRLHNKLPHAMLFAIAPWWGDSPHPDELAAVNAAVKAAVESVRGAYIDPGDPLLGHPDWMRDDADPNDRGYKAIAETDGPAIASRLSR